MRLKQLTSLGRWFIILVFLLLPDMVLAQESVIVQLESVNGSGVRGTATLSIAGEGTNVVLEVDGLTPETTVRSTMHAGSCGASSASFAALPGLEADANGKATATGSVLFHGEDVALATMADGEHIIVIRAEEVVACGVIPQLGSSPASLPETGGGASSLVLIRAGVFGFCLLCAGLFLRYSRRFLG
jgi:hypothetical protein